MGADLPSDLTPLILRGHVIDVLRSLPENSVQCCVTSPPYWGLRAYGTEPQVWGAAENHEHRWCPTRPRRLREEDDAGGAISKGNTGASYEAQGGDTCDCGAWRGELGLEPTPELYVDHISLVFEEVRRVLREDGTLWLNLGDTYATHPAGTTDERRTQASTLTKGRDISGSIQAGLMDKRAPGLKPKDLVGIPWRVAFRLQTDGWWLRSDSIWAKPNPMPESVTDRPTRSHEYVFLLTKNARYYYDADAVRVNLSRPEVEFPVGGASKGGRGAESSRNDWGNIVKQNPDGANLKSVWWIPTQPYPDAHFATFPERLPEIAILAGTSERGSCAECGTQWRREIRAEEGTIRTDEADWHPQKSIERGRRSLANGSPGLNSKARDGTYRRVDIGFKGSCGCAATVVPCVVLDPFGGSGTVAQVSRRLGRRSIGIELKPEYVALARRRSTADTPALERFEEAGP